MPELTDMQTIVTTAQEAVEPHAIPGAPGVFVAHDNLTLHDLHDILARRLPRPERKRGTFAFTDPVHLVGYLDKHKVPETEVYADVDKGTVTAVINAHEGSSGMVGDSLAGWGDHRAVLTLRPGDDWTRWTKGDGKWVSQTEFAEFIEQHLPCCVTPDGATMLELAQSFRATKSVKFEQSKRLKSGETQLEYRENVEAKAGARGSLDIPDEITLALAPFEHGAPYKVTARLRYRIDGGELALSYVLIRPRDILLDAFNAVITDVAAQSGREIWHGTSG
jgi:uncharacterized protein YfdQ (DUF2303 family)